MNYKKKILFILQIKKNSLSLKKKLKNNKKLDSHFFILNFNNFY